MIVHHAFALIDGDKVGNIIISNDIVTADKIARISYPDGFAVCCDSYPCIIGDNFINNKFTRTVDGKPTQIEKVTTDEDTIVNLELVIKELKKKLSELLDE